MPTIAVYAGSFDPITNGHADLVTTALPLVDRLVLGVGVNLKKKPLFTFDERVSLIEHVTQNPKVSVEAFDGLLVDFCRKLGATYIIRGLRAVSDFESEMVIAHTNRVLGPEITTLFLPTRTEHSFVSSSMVKEVAGHGGDVSHFVHPIVATALREKVKG